MTFTLLIILVTVVVSMSAFNNTNLYYQLILWPKRMHEPKEYIRLLTSGFIHADWNHLIFNMLTMYFFGRYVESAFGNSGVYLLLYLTAIIVASLPSFIKNKDNNYYMSLGASGGVSAILFSFVYMAPWTTIYVFFIPVPGILYAVFYIWYSIYMSKRKLDNVNHDAHLWGAAYGFLFTLLHDPTHGQLFWLQLTHPQLF